MRFSNLIKLGAISASLLYTTIDASAQNVFERKAVEVSNLGISFTTVGTVGRPNVRNVPVGEPSMEYPRGSGTEHLFEAGIWLGANVNGEIRVSTSAVTNSAGYSQGAAGFEFTNNGQLFLQRSSLVNDPNYSPVAISHQDLIAQFTDRNTTIGNQAIAGHTTPLFADIVMESYNWNFGFTEALTIVKYDITNNSQDAWRDFYFGIYSDMVVRNVNTTVETGSAYFNKGGMGWLDEQYAMYIFDRGSADQPRINTHAASVILGSEYRGVEFHPRRASEVIQAGLQPPRVSPDFWLFGSGAGDFSRPNDDLERYNRMVAEWPINQNRNALRNDGYSANGNYIQLNTIGPFPVIAAGETVTVYISFVAAAMPQQFQSLVPAQVQNVNDIDNEDSRANLVENIGWAFRLFDGTENEDGSRTRFLVPEPPTVPNMRVELNEGTASIYWDNTSEASIDPVTREQDFAGYKLYRTNLGDDLRGTISTNAQVLREWDLPGSGVGFNTGFDDIRLPQPVTFPDDPNEYHYKYQVSGMLNGWQYLFSVTAFDQGDDRTPPLETSINANAVRVFPGTVVNTNFGSDEAEFKVGVYPNPYRINAAWDGSTPFNRRIMFYNLPERAEIRVYTLAGEIVASMEHDAQTYTGDTRWFRDFSAPNRILSGGEHAWDLLSAANQNLTTGLYLYTVYDKNSGKVQQGRFVVIK
jgi:hypothetical protein